MTPAAVRTLAHRTAPARMCMRAPHYALANGLLELGSAGVAWPQPHAQVQLRGLRSGGSECTVAPHCPVLQCTAAHTAPRVLHAAPRRATVVCAVAAALLSTQGKPRGRAMRACTAGRRPPSRRVYEKRHGVRVRVRVCACVCSGGGAEGRVTETTATGFVGHAYLVGQMTEYLSQEYQIPFVRHSYPPRLVRA
jgi:hypothetical protein